MKKDQYRNTKFEADSIAKIKAHIKLEDTCPKLKYIMETTVFKKHSEDMLPLHDIKSLLGRIVFKKQNHDIMLENVV
jgi:hypothetical protein